jgi:hypothetical protein
MICQSLSCGVIAWLTLVLLGALSLSIAAIECDLLGIGRLIAPRYHLFFGALPWSGRRIWRATILSCAALIAATGLASSFYADMWPLLILVTNTLSPLILVSASGTILWAALKSVK